MLLGGASALAVLSFASSVYAQANVQTCPFTPAWNPCIDREDRDCATIKAPVDWTDGSKGFYDLRLIRIPAKNADENTQSILVNPGGPGGSGINYILRDQGNLQRIGGDNYHYVSMDPRGVGLNQPYKCTTSGGFGFDVSNRDTFASSLTSYQSAAKSCDDNFGTLGRTISTLQTAKDFNLTASVMGDGLIRYWGFSYGTLLGDTIARIAGPRVQRMVLDGNINPNDYYFQFPVEEAKDVTKAITNFFTLCAAATTQCAWYEDGQTAAGLLQKFDTWVGGDPIAKYRGRTTESSNLGTNNTASYAARYMLFDAMRNPRVWIKAAQILQNWYTYPCSMHYVSAGAIPDYVLQSNACAPQVSRRQSQPAIPANNGLYTPADTTQVITPQAITGITCVDAQYRQGQRAPALTTDQWQSWFNSYATQSKYSPEFSIALLYSCAPWITLPKEQLDYDTQRFQGLTTRTPILYVQTLYDPVTPEASGDAAHAAFTNSYIIKSSGAGHCSSAHRSTTLETQINLYWQATTVTPPAITSHAPDANLLNPFIVAPPAMNPVDENAAQSENPSGNMKRNLLDMWYPAMEIPASTLERLRYRKRQSTTAANVPIYGQIDDVDVEVCDTSDSNSTTTTSATTSSASSTAITNGTTTSAISTTTTISETTYSTSTTISGTTYSTSTMTGTTTGTGSTLSSTTGRFTGTTTGTYNISATSTRSYSYSTGFTSSTGWTNTYSFTRPSSGTYSSSWSTPSYSASWSTGPDGKPVWTTTASSRYGKPTDGSGNGYNDDQSTWVDWTSSTRTTSTRTSWDPKSSSTSAAKTWGPWDPKDSASQWAPWTSQADSVPITKTFCGSGKDKCTTTVVAAPTRTVYVDSVVDVCETGIITKTVTITATCAKGCQGGKPTGVPQGYTTSKVWCSGCAIPTTVVVTVKVFDPAAGKPTQWDNTPAAATTPAKPGNGGASSWNGWADNAASPSTKPADPAAVTWSAWSGTAASSSTKPADPAVTWSAWSGNAASSPVKPADPAAVAWSAWSGNAASSSTKPADPAAATWATWAGDSNGASSSAKSVDASSAAWGTWADPAAATAAAQSGSATWSDWDAASATGPKIAKYTGGAAANTVARGGLFAVVFAGLFML